MKAGVSSFKLPHHLDLEHLKECGLFKAYFDQVNNKVLEHDFSLSTEKAWAILLLVLLLPVFLFISLLQKIFSRGPVFYSQIRVGKNGRLFSMYKFRSMVVNAEKKTGAVLSSENDSRVTKIGNFLRATHIDELPQLINIIQGDMSFIGPRPERPCFVSKFEDEILNYSRRKLMKPGVTGLAQICLHYNASAAEKLKLDLFYYNFKDSLSFNAIILYYTIKKIFFFKSFNGVFNDLSLNSKVNSMIFIKGENE